jgi:hypothetical protein
VRRTPGCHSACRRRNGTTHALRRVSGRHRLGHAHLRSGSVGTLLGCYHQTATRSTATPHSHTATLITIEQSLPTLVAIMRIIFYFLFTVRTNNHLYSISSGRIN